jgi:hypothetical protein
MFPQFYGFERHYKEPVKDSKWKGKANWYFKKERKCVGLKVGVLRRYQITSPLQQSSAYLGNHAEGEGTVIVPSERKASVSRIETRFPMNPLPVGIASKWSAIPTLALTISKVTYVYYSKYDR